MNFPLQGQLLSKAPSSHSKYIFTIFVSIFFSWTTACNKQLMFSPSNCFAKKNHVERIKNTKLPAPAQQTRAQRTENSLSTDKRRCREVNKAPGRHCNRIGQCRRRPTSCPRSESSPSRGPKSHRHANGERARRRDRIDVLDGEHKWVAKMRLGSDQEAWSKAKHGH